MARKSLKEFKKLYNAQFLATSLSSYKVGYKIDWDGVFNNRLDVDEFYFTNLFKGMDQAQRDKLNKELDKQNKVASVEAQLTAVDIEQKQDIGFAAKIPMWGDFDLSAKLNFDKVMHFSYENVEARSLSGEAMNHIVQYVSSLSKKEQKDVGHIQFFKVLYYADSVSMTFSSDYADEAKTTIDNINLDADVSVTGNNNETIILKGAKHSPFAAVIESVGDLLD